MTLSIEEFLARPGPCFDVRSPSEFLHAKIPGAISLPLFSNEERALVGTAYKRQGKDIAIRLGVKIVGPKLDAMLTDASEHISEKETARVYCWRGGMRSGFVRYFLDFAGIPTVQLKGGYKAFRRFALTELSKPCRLFVIGGFTGCGKTEVLQELKGQVIDLEALAAHRGSVYGDLADRTQPSNESFENALALSLYRGNREKSFWVEDESRMIGRCQIPSAFYDAMQRAPLFVINSSKEARIQRILELYSAFSKEHLIDSTKKIAKRLGGASTQKVLSFIEQGALVDAVCLLLEYYDKTYEYSISKHAGPVVRLSEPNKNWATTLEELSHDSKFISNNGSSNTKPLPA